MYDRQETKCDATIILWGENLIPDEITALVGLPPSHSRKKGENPPGRKTLSPRILAVGMWTLCTAQFIASKSLSHHLVLLSDKLGDKINILKAKGAIDKARISAVVQVEESEPGVASWEDELDPVLLEKIARLGASLALTVMWPLADAGLESGNI